MELDLRFKQYELTEPQVVNDLVGQATEAKKPYQEIIDYLENNKKDFYFMDFSKIFNNVTGMLNLTLSDGAKVAIAKRDNIMNIAIQYPDKTRFVGTWSNIQDANEFYKKCQSLE